MAGAWRQNWKVRALILYGCAVVILALVAFGRQVQLLRQIWGVGDPGITLKQEPDGQSWQVTEVDPGSPAAAVLQAGDRVLQLGDLTPSRVEATMQPGALSDFWQYKGRPVAPGQSAPVTFERGTERQRVEPLEFGFSAPFAQRFGPLTPRTGPFLFGVFVPSRLQVWVYLILGWVVLLRRPTSRAAQLFFLFAVTWAFTVSYWFVRPSDLPMPLRWLKEYPEVVRAWFVAFLLHLAFVTPEAKALYRRCEKQLAVAIYVPAGAVTGLALVITIGPELRPGWLWLKHVFYARYAFPYFLVTALLMAHSAVTASTTAAQRQARTMLVGFLPYLVQFTCGVVLGLPFAVSGTFGSIFQSVMHLLIPVSFAFAILRQGLMDVGLLIRQGLVYATVLAVGVAGYFVLVVGTGNVLLAVTGETKPPAIMAAALALALLLRPVTVHARRWIDRAFYRDRLEAGRRLRALIQEMLSLLDRDAVVEKLTCELPAVFPAKSATLFLLDPTDDRCRPAGAEAGVAALSHDESLLIRRLRESGRPVSTYDVEVAAGGEPLTDQDRETARRLGAVMWLPLMLRDRLVGTLALGWKASEEIYTEDELEALCLIASEAAVALENAALSAEREEQARLQQEVEIGRAIQMRLLPPPHLRRGSFEILSRSEPANEVGGDFYNLFELGNGKGDARLGIVLGDVAGKGVPGALFMAVTTTLIEGQAQLLPSPADTLAAANAQLRPKMRPPGGEHPLFATAIYGVLDVGRGEMRLANAGQTPPIHWPASGEPRYVRLRGVPLGALPGTRYEEATLQFAPGDRLLFCSDGFIEVRNPEGEPVGYDGFLRRLTTLAGFNGPQLLEALFDGRETGATEAADPFGADDRTLVLITATAPPETPGGYARTKEALSNTFSSSAPEGRGEGSQGQAQRRPLEASPSETPRPGGARGTPCPRPHSVRPFGAAKDLSPHHQGLALRWPLATFPAPLRGGIRAGTGSCCLTPPKSRDDWTTDG